MKNLFIKHLEYSSVGVFRNYNRIYKKFKFRDYGYLPSTIVNSILNTKLLFTNIINVR